MKKKQITNNPRSYEFSHNIDKIPRVRKFHDDYDDLAMDWYVDKFNNALSSVNGTEETQLDFEGQRSGLLAIATLIFNTEKDKDKFLSKIQKSTKNSGASCYVIEEEEE